MEKSREEIVAEFDARLEESTRRMQEESAKIREENKRLEVLVLEKQALLQNMEAMWRLTRKRRTRIDKEIAEILQAA
jgi:hypothetical protein